MLPAMRHFNTRHIAWINPPFIPYAPALAAQNIDTEHLLILHPASPDIPWAIEQLLRVCGKVLAWPDTLGWNALRRLQLAATEGRSLGMLFRRADAEPSPAALRLALKKTKSGLTVDFLKVRGSGGSVQLVV